MSIIQAKYSKNKITYPPMKLYTNVNPFFSHDHNNTWKYWT
jgi:hypothetical protein